MNTKCISPKINTLKRYDEYNSDEEHWLSSIQNKDKNICNIKRRNTVQELLCDYENINDKECNHPVINKDKLFRQNTIPDINNINLSKR